MIFFLVVSFIVGSAIGSFLNVVVDRTTRRKTILGRSYCDHCRVILKTIDLVPILSFAMLGGKCRFCKKSLSWQYPLVEAFCGFLFLLSFYVLVVGGNLNLAVLLYWFFLCSILVIVSVVDLKFSLIPTSFVYFASLVALLFNFLYFSPPLFFDHVIAAFLSALFFLLIVVFTRGKGMGEGDIVLGFLIGMVLGLKSATLAVFLAFLIGSVVSLLLIALGKKKFGQTIPFAPFLVCGLLVGMFWGEKILSWYLMLY